MLYERLKAFFFSDSFKSIMNKLTSLGSLWIFYDVYQCHCWLETVIFTCSNSLVPQCSLPTPPSLELLCLNMIIKPFKGLSQWSSGTLSSRVRRPGSTPGQGTRSHMQQLRPGAAQTNKQTNTQTNKQKKKEQFFKLKNVKPFKTESE